MEMEKKIGLIGTFDTGELSTELIPPNFTEPDDLFEILKTTVSSYHPSSDLDIIIKAYDLAKDAHKEQKRKEQGVVKHIGLSSHTPATIQKVLDDVSVDMLMFSVNPGYDYQKGEYAKGSVDERSAVYSRCEREGIGISVMKPFSGGQMLDAAVSPFGKALTQYQCMQYAMDRPGVLTVLPGMSNVEQVEHLLGFFEAEEGEKDYSVIGTFSPAEAVGKCVYCNHCKPCPRGLDIGIIYKYYDLARNGDSMAAEHYRNLEVKADACVQCGHCEARCPFHVKQEERMKEIAAYFGRKGVSGD